MRAISSNETARKRSAVTPKRDSTAVLKRPTLTTDGAGGYTDSLTTVGTYSCRVAPTTKYNFPLEMIKAKQMKDMSAWSIALPDTVSVTLSDIIEVGTAKFEVVGEQGAKSPKTETLVICYRVV